MAFSELDSITLCLLILLASAARSAAARDVRPSDHGLGYQQQGQGTPPSADDASPPQMMSFFGASAPPPAPPSALPRASNSTETTSWMRPSSGSRRRDRVREILLVVSLVCGVTGVALLIGSALFFLFKFRRENRSAAPKSTSRPPSPPAAVDINCRQ